MEYCRAKGISFTRESQIAIEDKVRSMGAEIIRGKGRTHYGIATCVCQIADAIINSKSTTISVSSILMGEYGISDIALSLPSIVNSNGIERRLAYELDDEVTKRLNATADELKAICGGI
jgi:L-lactate dehydrogenase